MNNEILGYRKCKCGGTMPVRTAVNQKASLLPYTAQCEKCATWFDCNTVEGKSK